MLLACGAALGLAGFAVAAFLAWLAFNDPFGDRRHPTDVEMLEQFSRHRAELEQLVELISEDAELDRLAPDFTRPDPAPLPPERIADYRRRLAAAGIRHGFSHYGDQIIFIVSTRGLAIAGSAKNFAYAETPSQDAIVVQGDLDAAASDPVHRDGALFRRPLAGKWWLELDTR